MKTTQRPTLQEAHARGYGEGYAQGHIDALRHATTQQAALARQIFDLRDQNKRLRAAITIALDVLRRSNAPEPDGDIARSIAAAALEAKS